MTELYGVSEIASTNDTTSPAQNANSAGQRTDGLGRDAFLRLLVAQLQYQNPMEPMKDQEFIAQLAQFSALEELTMVREAVEEVVLQLSGETVLFSQGLALLGCNVTVKTHGGQELTGIVSGLRREAGETLLVIGTETISVTNLEEVELR